MRTQLSSLLVISVLAAVALATDAPPAKPAYSDKYAGVNIDQILASEDLVQGYFECLMDRGPCSQGGQDIKRVLPEALASDCARCNERQRGAADKIISFLLDKKPTLWQELERKYDPQGAYRSRHPAA